MTTKVLDSRIVTFVLAGHAFGNFLLFMDGIDDLILVIVDWNCNSAFVRCLLSETDLGSYVIFYCL